MARYTPKAKTEKVDPPGKQVILSPEKYKSGTLKFPFEKAHK